jgi:hypothetical protein
MRTLHAPLVHFVAGGGLLFLLVREGGPPRPAYGERTSDPITITAADVARLRDDYTRETGLAAAPADEASLVEKTIEEELLFREAVARGLDRNDRSVRTWLIEQMQVLSNDRDADPNDLYARALRLGLDRTDLVVRRILVQKMRLLAERIDEQPPGEDELRSFYESQRDGYRAPDRVSFWHVFFASGRSTDASDAAALLAALREHPEEPRAAVRHGDSFAASPHLVEQSPAQVAKLFGASFAADLQRAESSAWIGPLTSPYGTHLVWIDSRVPAAPPPFEAVRGQVLERWQSERRAQRRAQLLRDLRTRYPLQIESAAWHQSGWAAGPDREMRRTSSAIGGTVGAGSGSSHQSGWAAGPDREMRGISSAIGRTVGAGFESAEQRGVS